jgi:hypothetical protein
MDDDQDAAVALIAAIAAAGRRFADRIYELQVEHPGIRGSDDVGIYHTTEADIEDVPPETGAGHYVGPRIELSLAVNHPDGTDGEWAMLAINRQDGTGWAVERDVGLNVGEPDAVVVELPLVSYGDSLSFALALPGLLDELLDHPLPTR